MFHPTRGGTRGGQGDFKWTDVAADKDREYYLGHSLNAPVGRWQNGKDLTWYQKDKDRDLEEEERVRREEIRKVKEAEEDALAVALGFAPVVRNANETPIGSSSKTSAPPPKDSNEAILEKARHKAEKEARKRERDEKRRERELRKQERRSGDSKSGKGRERELRNRSRSRTRSRSPERSRRRDERGGSLVRERERSSREDSHRRRRYDDEHERRVEREGSNRREDYRRGYSRERSRSPPRR